MAEDWIKMRTNLTRDPRVNQIAAECGVSANEVIGALFRLWSLADEQTTDGFLPGATLDWIDAQTGVSGLAVSLTKIRKKPWLIVRKGGAKVPRFHEHCSQTAKQRALTAKRMQRKRDADGVTDTSPEGERKGERKRRGVKESSKTKGADCAGGVAASDSPRSVCVPSSDSDSGDARKRAHVRFQAAVAPHIGRNGSTRLPPGNAQADADLTCTRHWWAEHIWPEDLPPPEGEKRLAQFIDICQRAQTKTTPMAWITKTLKQELPT